MFPGKLLWPSPLGISLCNPRTCCKWLWTSINCLEVKGMIQCKSKYSIQMIVIGAFTFVTQSALVELSSFLFHGPSASAWILNWPSPMFLLAPSLTAFQQPTLDEELLVLHLHSTGHVTLECKHISFTANCCNREEWLTISVLVGVCMCVTGIWGLRGEY